MNGETRKIVELVGIYDADGTILGELRYVIGRQFRGTHCSLCDITHGALRERAEWKAARATLPVPFVAIHRNDCSPELRATAGQLPAVIARLDDGTSCDFLTAAELTDLGPDPQGLVDALHGRAEELGIAWTTPDGLG